MSEYELLDIYNSTGNSLAMYIMNFVSILSGYLLATYFLGARLSKIQFSILTFAYLAVMGITILGIFVKGLELGAITSEIDSLELEWWISFPAEAWAMVVIMGAHVLTLFGSLYFGYSSVLKQEQ